MIGRPSSGASNGGGLMSLALDTSVVVRLLVGEPADQHDRARGRLERARAEAEPVYVTDLVVVETYYAIRHHYGVPDGEARSRLAQFLASGVVEPDPAGLGEAVAAGPPPGLADRLIHHRHGERGSTTVTFDRGQAALAGAELL